MRLCHYHQRVYYARWVWRCRQILVTVDNKRMWKALFLMAKKIIQLCSLCWPWRWTISMFLELCCSNRAHSHITVSLSHWKRCSWCTQRHLMGCCLPQNSIVYWEMVKAACLESRISRFRTPLRPSSFKDTDVFSPLTRNDSILWGTSVTER